MFLAIKRGQFHPDMTRSGMMVGQHQQQHCEGSPGVGQMDRDVQVLSEKPMIRLQPGPYQSAGEVVLSGVDDFDNVKTSDAETPDLQAECVDDSFPGDSASESSSGESEFTDDEVLHALQIANDVPEFVWKEGCSVFLFSKT